MFLKDPQYKPHMNSQTYGKSNPFETLTQLKGVKKIIGANPSTYTAGVCDLFSSCFEIRVTKDTAAFPQRNTNGKTKTVQQAKSLPSSPKITQRKLSKIDKFVLQTSSKNNEINDPNTTVVDDLFTNIKTKKSSDTIERKKLELLDVPNQCQTYNNNNTKCNANIDAMNDYCNDSAVICSRTGTLKKKNASSLFSHPLFKCKEDRGRDDSYFFENPKLLTRGGSSESGFSDGFFSCLTDDDFSTQHPHRPFAKNHQRWDTNGLSINGPCDYEHTINYIDDRSSTIPSSLRSFDDFDLFERNAKIDCSGAAANDSLSIDMGLVNRLSLDSEINSLFHKHQLNNQLLYCKNRTSSIYTDSSEDISSLAGSDSLLWDDRMSSYSTTIPNTRSAQIAKIVEYFERKGQTFKNAAAANCTLSSDRHHISSISTGDYSSVATARTYLPSSNRCPIYLRNNNNNSNQLNASTDENPNYTLEQSQSQQIGSIGMVNTANSLAHPNNENGVTMTANRKSQTSSSSPSTVYQTTNASAASTSKEYEAFCLDLDKDKGIATPQRLNVCEGVVKSKLQLFDKLRNN